MAEQPTTNASGVQQLISRIRDSLDVDVPLMAIFEHSTPASLASHVARVRSQAPAEPVAPIVRLARRRRIPRSPS